MGAGAEVATEAEREMGPPQMFEIPIETERVRIVEGIRVAVWTRFPVVFRPRRVDAGTEFSGV